MPPCSDCSHWKSSERETDAVARCDVVGDWIYMRERSGQSMYPFRDFACSNFKSLVEEPERQLNRWFPIREEWA